MSTPHKHSFSSVSAAAVRKISSVTASGHPAHAMPRVERFDIEFDPPCVDTPYFAGQRMSGRVLIELKEDKKINALLMEFKGRARTYWTKYSGKSRQHCSDSEPYFCEQFNTNYTQQLQTLTDTDGKQVKILPAGVHEIPFEFTLPKSLPSSFEGDFGYVRYTCKATLERPWDFDILCKRAFTVIGIEDSIDAVRLTDSRFDIRYCCRAQGSISVSLQLSRTGYAPGEPIVVHAGVENNSRRTLRYSQEQTKQTEKVVCKIERSEIGAHSEYTWSNVELRVPPVPPKLARCRIIDVNYALEFEVDPGITVISPIFIGTIPLIRKTMSRAVTPHLIDSTVHTTAVHVECTDDAAAGDSRPSSILKQPAQTAAAATLAELYPQLTPPTFEHSLFGATDIGEDNERVAFGELKFTPKYACYRQHIVRTD